MKDDIKPARRPKAVAAAIKTKLSPKPSEEPAKEIAVADESSKPQKIRLHRRVHWWLKSLSPKQMIILGAAFLVLLGGGYMGLRSLSKNPVKEAASIDVIKKEEPPKPTTVPSRMTGVQVTPELNALQVTGVMIENSPDARPQSGLTQADMVFEAIAEGGITRFLALYQESQPDYIGPVRSARPYYLDFLAQYDAAIAHAGGSAEALAQIRNQGIKDIDHGANGSTYQRVSSRYAPHNLYTSRAKIQEAQNRRGYTSSNYKGLARKEAATPAATPTARSLDFKISSFLYNPHFDYDATSNTYKRSEGGKPHVDERSGAQISPSVVVALVMSHHYAGIYSVYQTTGSGSAYVFQDGVVTPATWTKANRKAELVLTGADGAVLPLNPGQTWFSLVSSAGAVTYAP